MFFAGGDWANQKHDALVLDEVGRQAGSIRVSPTPEGLTHLDTFLSQILGQQSKDHMACIILSENAWWNTAWMMPSTIAMGHVPAPLFWMESRKPICLPFCGAPVLPNKLARIDACWPTIWWNWATWNTSATKRCARRSKNELKPWLKQYWCIPPEASLAFVWRMEDVLEVYTRPYDPRFPQVCIDENAKQLLRDKRESLPLQAGQPKRVDYTFEAAGMCKLFLACEPLTGKRSVSVTKRRTSKDWAHFIYDLVDVHYSQAEKIVLVLDNLNTHTPSSLYQTFAPAEARHILQKLEIHYTPVHGSPVQYGRD